MHRFARAIAAAQNFMRAELHSPSAVSQRDIIRVVRLLVFFRQHSFAQPDVNERCRAARALLLALGVSFYLGLNSSQRQLFTERVTARHYAEIFAEETCHSLDLPSVLAEEMDVYMRAIQLPSGIALTRALKENIFAVIVGIQCNIPVMACQAPERRLPSTLPRTSCGAPAPCPSSAPSAMWPTQSSGTSAPKIARARRSTRQGMALNPLNPKP